jgi:hypothetical protein
LTVPPDVVVISVPETVAVSVTTCPRVAEVIVVPPLFFTVRVVVVAVCDANSGVAPARRAKQATMFFK